MYKEQKELDPLPTISDPSLSKTKGSKPTSRKEKKLIVLHNFSSLETCTCIMREMKDASTDVIVVSNELFCKEEIVKDFNKQFNRGCNIIEVTNLQPISIMQRMVYGLLEKNSFVARDADHIVFTLLSEYSRGAATIVHLLTSLMQKSDDNSRTGFELAKQQLKLHIAHQKLNNYGMQNALSEARSTANASKKTQDHGENAMTKRDPQTMHDSDDYSSFSSPQGLQHPIETFISEVTRSCVDDKRQADVSESQSYKGTSIIQSGSIQIQIKGLQDNYTGEPTSSIPNRQVTSTSQPARDRQTMTSSIIEIISAGDKQTTSFQATQPPTRAKPGMERLDSAKKHPIYLYINDLLSTTCNISLPAHHLLNCLAITGPIPLPVFYVEELDNVVMNAVFNKEKRIQAESPMKQLIKGGVIRKSCYPIVYHKDLNTDYLDLSIQQMFVPKLICDAVKVEMDGTDKALSVLSAQRALENSLTNEIKLSSIHLQYILILCNQLQKVCNQESHELGDELLVTNQKLKLWVAIMARELKV